MIDLPQNGGCLCGAVRYELREAPILVYACHCTDCQTESGAACYLAIVAREEAVEYTRGELEPWKVTLADGREKGALHCPTCRVTVGGIARPDGLRSLHAGTLDDTTWVRPSGHIWARSAQPWVRFPEDDVLVDTQPTPEEWGELVRVWVSRQE